ncbi:MAG: hypothetical protein AMJ79_07735 [Phycisphaerae bacterium SM23_30]|nr:MAG: hypothetical protein AMJ79_07735 [Phycisphaerae bacterium SM23_30]
MTFPTVRLSRLRSHEIFRRMVRQITLRVDDLVAPLFVYHGEKVKNAIGPMPGPIYYLPIMPRTRPAGWAEPPKIIS